MQDKKAKPQLNKDSVLIQTIIREASKKDHIVVDAFCGLGGVTEGFGLCDNYYVIACINHWDLAIENHELFHPTCLHLTEDFSTADLTLVDYIISEVKKINPNVTVHGWFSFDCKEHSLAKGGMPKNPGSRTLAIHLPHYLTNLPIDTIWVENVKEFLMWGPLIAKVTIMDKKKRKTVYYNPEEVEASEFFEPYINAATYPQCPLSFEKKKKKIISYGPWLIPEPKSKGQYFNAWRDDIESYGYKAEHRLLNCADFGVPQHRVRLFMQFNKPDVKAAWPKKTHDKKGKNGLPKWLPIKGCLDLENEGESVLKITKNKKGAWKPRITSAKSMKRLMDGTVKHALSGDDTFITLYYSNGQQNSKLTSVSPAIPCKDRASLTTVRFINQSYSSGKTNQSLEDTSGAVTAVPKLDLVEIDRLIMDTQYNNGCHSINETARCQTANRKHFYVISYQYNNIGKSIEDASPTVIASMDKYPPYLITTEEGELAIEIYDYDPPHIVDMKRFMAFYGIVSIKMRMLSDVELLRIMTIDETRKLLGTSADRKEMIGNAVPPLMVKALAEEYDRNNIKSPQQILFAA